MKIQIDGKEYPFDPDALTFDESCDLEGVFGGTFGELPAVVHVRVIHERAGIGGRKTRDERCTRIDRRRDAFAGHRHPHTRASVEVAIA